MCACTGCGGERGSRGCVKMASERVKERGSKLGSPAFGKAPTPINQFHFTLHKFLGNVPPTLTRYDFFRMPREEIPRIIPLPAILWAQPKTQNRDYYFSVYFCVEFWMCEVFFFSLRFERSKLLLTWRMTDGKTYAEERDRQAKSYRKRQGRKSTTTKYKTTHTHARTSHTHPHTVLTKFYKRVTIFNCSYYILL